jgi:hypothetical protein
MVRLDMGDFRLMGVASWQYRPALPGFVAYTVSMYDPDLV